MSENDTKQLKNVLKQHSRPVKDRAGFSPEQLSRMKSVSLIGLPFYSLSKYHGMGMASGALRKLGIADVVRQHAQAFKDLGDVVLSEIEADSGPSNLRNFPQFLADTDIVLGASSEVDPDDFVFCLGGECTFIVGSMAGFKTRFKGTPGVLWMDAHGDFNTPETTISGFIGGMCLAFACGRGPKLTSTVENARPLLNEENVVHLGSRSLDPLESEIMKSSSLRLYSAAKVHETGVREIAREAARYLAERSDWIICHLDVDSIDPTIISAVNFREEGGMTMEEVRTVVRELFKTQKMKVFDLAAYNPALDVNNHSGNQLVKLTSQILSADPLD
jgi:arginase